MSLRPGQLNASLNKLLREYEQLIYHLENTPLAVIEYDQDFRITRWSAQARKLFGWSRAEVIGKHNLDLHLVHPSDRGKVASAIQRLINRAEPRNILRNRNFRKDGSILLCEWYNSALLDGAGRVHSILSLAQDITHFEQSFMERAIASVGERERQRIGHELHDALAQQLTGVAFLSKALQAKLLNQAPDLAKDANHLARMTSDAALQVRNLSSGLYPAELERRGLVSALTELSLGLTSIYSTPCTLQADAEQPELDSTAALNLYRIAQEAINNALKHGKPKRIQVRLRSTPSLLVLTIKDDGVGIRREKTTQKGMGIRIMRYRAESMGAALEVERSGGKGTRVTCRLPLPKALKK
jgi:PAS domain S-box-containing protein